MKDNRLTVLDGAMKIYRQIDGMLAEFDNFAKHYNGDAVTNDRFRLALEEIMDKVESKREFRESELGKEIMQIINLTISQVNHVKEENSRTWTIAKSMSGLKTNSMFDK